MLGREQRGARPAGRPELELGPVAHAAAELEQLAQRDAERRLVLAGALHVAGQRVERVALALLGAHRGEPLGAVQHDAGHRGDRLDVVHDGRARVEAVRGRERRAQPRLAAVALERVEQRRLLAADVRAGAGVDHDVEVEAAAVDVLAQVTGGAGLLDGVHHAAVDVDDLAAQVDEGLARADRVGRDDDALHELVRVRHHERGVLAGARLGLVGVDHEVVGLGALALGALRDEAPLHAGGEAGAAAAAQAGVLDELDQGVRVHGERLGQRLVAAVAGVAADREGVGVAPVAGQDGSQHYWSFLSAVLGDGLAALLRRLRSRRGWPGRPARPAWRGRRGSRRARATSP